jgi:hypothetical protein
VERQVGELGFQVQELDFYKMMPSTEDVLQEERHDLGDSGFLQSTQ